MKTNVIGIFLAGLLLAGCSGLGSLNPLNNLVPKPSPTPVLTVVPSTLTMKTSGATSQQKITASESGQTFFTAETSNVNVATVSAVSGSSNAFTVTAVGTGSCKINVTDEFGQTVAVSVNVSS